MEAPPTTWPLASVHPSGQEEAERQPSEWDMNKGASVSTAAAAAATAACRRAAQAPAAPSQSSETFWHKAASPTGQDWLQGRTSVSNRFQWVMKDAGGSFLHSIPPSGIHPSVPSGENQAATLGAEHRSPSGREPLPACSFSSCTGCRAAGGAAAQEGGAGGADQERRAGVSERGGAELEAALQLGHQEVGCVGSSDHQSAHAGKKFDPTVTKST